MASFIEKILSRFTKQKQANRISRRAKHRALRLEPMEMRRLLAGDIGSIGGNLYSDLTDDGLDAGDAAVVGASVYLFRDGGDNTFNSSGGTAGGDDVLIGTVNSDASGDYLFEGLIAGTYFVDQEAAAGFLQRPAESPKTVVITELEAAGVFATNIDTYDTTAQIVTSPQGITNSDSANTGAGETIGDERDIQVVNTGLLGAGDLEANNTAGVLIINTDSGAQGNVIVTYDGDDDDATTINFDPLTSLNADLTASGGTAFHLLATSEAGNTITIDVYSTATDFSSITVPMPVTGSLLTFENLILNFADFTPDAGGTGADFTDVAAIRLQLDIAESADARIDFSQIVSPFVSTQNFQNLLPMSIGNLVFADSNNSGSLDAGEAGIAGVEIELYQDDGNGSFDDDVLIDPLVATTTTDVNGNYLFQNLLPGDYIAVIRLSEFATAADPLFGHVTSTGNDPTPNPNLVVVDNDDNGFFLAGVGVVTFALTLASGTEPTSDGDTDTNSNLMLDFGFVAQTDLEIVKTVDQQAKIAGNQVTYTLEVTNNGDATANNVLVVDDLPDFLEIDSVVASGGGVVNETSNANGEIEVTYASLASLQTETITIIATIPASQAAAAGVINTATISADGQELEPNDNSDTATIDITRQAILSLTKTDAPDPTTVGSQLTYQILVTNTGPSTATNVVVSDTLPVGLTFGTVTTTAGTAVENAGVITVNIPALDPNDPVTVTIVTTILSSFAGSTITNSASADADEADLVNADAETTLEPQIDLEITKSDRADPVSRGDELVYDIVVTNNGPRGATNVEVLDTLPAGVEFVSATGGTVIPPAAGSDEVLIEVGDLAAQGTANITVTVRVLEAAAATIVNNALVRSDESIAGQDTDTTNNTAAEDTAVQSEIDLAIVKSDSADPVVPGEAFVYTVVVTNNGPSSADSIVVTDNLPDGIRITSATSSVGTVTIPPTAQDDIAANNDDLTVAIASLASGGTATVTINATVLPATIGVSGLITNVVNVASTNVNLIETITDNNTDSEGTTLTPEVDLRVTKVDSVDPVTPNADLTYTIVVTNDGPSTATNVNLTDSLPSGVTFTSVTSTQGTATQAGGIVTAAIGTLAPAATATITLVVTVNATATASIANTAAVTSTEPDSDTTNNSATANTTISPRVNLAITKTDSADPIPAGSNLTYTLTVTNTGPSAATNVIVTDNLPAALTFVSGTSTVGAVTNVGNNVTVTIPTLASGATATITLNTTVAATQTVGFTNTASVTATETDLVPGNNTVSETTEIAVPSSISGVVYIDVNRNGVRDTGEPGISGVAFALAGTDTIGNSITRSTTSDTDGGYEFDELLPGIYTVTQTQPPGFIGADVNLGTGGVDGTAGINSFTVELVGVPAVAFNFPELRPAFSKRLFLNTTFV